MPDQYALAICRIEPENNVEMILDALEGADLPLVFVGNWSNSKFGRDLHARYNRRPGFYLLDPVYKPSQLYGLRRAASVYVHGHSAGGTNPSLVEMMHFGLPILAFDCAFNRYTTEHQATYFANAKELAALVASLASINNGSIMKRIADRLFLWDKIGERYFSLLQETAKERKVSDNANQ